MELNISPFLSLHASGRFVGVVGCPSTLKRFGCHWRKVLRQRVLRRFSVVDSPSHFAVSLLFWQWGRLCAAERILEFSPEILRCQPLGQGVLDSLSLQEGQQ